MSDVGKQAVEKALGGQNLASEGSQGIQRIGRVLFPTAPEGVDQERNIDIFINRLQSGLVHANRCFQAADDEVVDFVVAKVALDPWGV